MASQPSRDAIIAAVVAPFRLGDAQEQALAEAIYAAAVASAQAAFDDAVASLDIDSDATLPDDVLSALASAAQDDAASIVATYNADLASAAERLAAGVSDDALESTLKVDLADWADARAAWKSAQIAQYTTGRGYSTGIDWLVSDLQSGDLALPDGTALSDLVVIVAPDDAAEPYCAALVAGSPYPVDAADAVLGDALPAHPNCDHYAYVDFAS